MALSTFDRQDVAALDGELARMYRALQDRPLSEVLRWTVEQLDGADEDVREVCVA